MSVIIPPEVVIIDRSNQPSEAMQPNAGVEQAVSRRPPPHPVFWVIAIVLVVIATVLVVRPDAARIPMLGNPAFAQPVSSGGARGLFAFSGQLSKSTYGLYMVDMDTMTVWTYEYLPQKGCLRLAAARTWRYDRYLENHNICDLAPDAVEQMIEDQRQYRRRTSETETP
jgi:hypothetical protein